MRTIEQLCDEVAALKKTLGELEAVATAESRDMNEAEMKLADDCIKEIGVLRRKIDLQKRIEKTTEELEQPITHVEKPEPEGEKRHYGDLRITREDDPSRFRSFGEQLAAIILASADRPRVDPRLLETRATGLSEGIASEGGYI